jgi:hypothetical protein
LSRGSYEDQNLRLLILLIGLLGVLQMLVGYGGGSGAEPPEPRLSVAPMVDWTDNPRKYGD